MVQCDVELKTKIGQRRCFILIFGLNRKGHGMHFLGDYTYRSSKLRLRYMMNVFGSAQGFSKVIIEWNKHILKIVNTTTPS